ncbi:lysine-specific demethylase 3B [Parasteatoda tepidariorum]|uniref:lysine-specific demethylase 3B n=1 Tax=Parasteatoda tepidariorum TaxID=114398 RepID=UPI001C72678F|nr:lysine-specific demethylase 3B [Parasteatoda tepidariorum]XP_015924627.2 lysine-specific demethylase 3B [Parasteatoda tepidariorum]
MSHLGSNESSKGEKTQSHVNNQSQRGYYNESYNRANHERNFRENVSAKELVESEQSHDREQYHALSSGARHPELLAHESMNPSVAASHSAAVASAAAVYPRVISQPNRAIPPSHFESYGLSSHVPPNPATSTGHHHSAPIHSSAHRHLLPHHALIPAQFNNSSGPSHIGVDIMWQQKMNPNPWMMAAHYGEMSLERERTLNQERSINQERERSINQERERSINQERERSINQERERSINQERERSLNQEREREHERMERQKEDKERHRDWDQDRLEREERERAQREAVKQHFEESLRLVLQKNKNMGWNPSTGKHGVGKQQDSMITMQGNQPVRTTDSDRQKEQEKERAQFVENSHRREHERWLALMQQQQRNEQSANAAAHHQNFSAMEARSGRNPPKSEPQLMQGQRPTVKQNLAPSPVNASPSQLKNEVNFSLYGYQPVRQTYITPAQLKAREEKITASMQNVRIPSGQHKANLPVKIEKEDFAERPSSPNSSHSSSKHQQKVMIPSHDRNNLMYQPLVGSGGAFKPYEYSSNSNSPAPPAHQNTSPALLGRMGTAQYPPLQDQPQNLVKSDGKSIHEKMPSHKYECRDLKPVASAAGTLPAGFSPPYGASKSTSPATNATYSYSLIQQGLVPNPMYIAATHSVNNAGASTPASFAYSQSSKTSVHPASPPISQQYARASPNSGISSGSPVCRPSSVPYTLPSVRVSRSYSPVGSLNSSGIGNANKGIIPQDPHLSNRAHISVQGSSHRSPSPAHTFGQQTNLGAPNSPHQSSTRMTSLASQSSIHLSSANTMPSSPFHSNSQPETSESSGVPLVKRKLLNDVISRKKPKQIDDSLLPPQLQPQIQTSCRENNESQVITPPDLSLNPPILGEHNSESYSSKSGPPSPLTSSNIIFKPEPVATPPSMPDLSSSSPVSQSDLDSTVSAQNYYTSFNKYKLPNKDTVNNLTDEKDSLLTSSDRTNVPSDTASNNSEEQVSNPNISSVVSSNNSNSSSSFHPKLKKAWLQRHSENTDRKCPGEFVPNTGKTDYSFKIKSENVQNETDDASTSESGKQTYSSTQSGNDDVDKICDDGNSETTNQALELNADEEISSSESDTECDTKSGKRKSKSKSKFLSGSFGVNSNGKRIKSENSSDPPVDDQTSPKKEKDGKKKSGLEKESSINSRKRGRKSKVRKSMSKNASTMKPPEKPSVAQLKKTGEAFLQDGSCCEVAPRLPKCRECRLTPHQRSKKMPNIFCRFYAYRKLRYGKNGTILSAGFSEPSDAAEEDLKLWLPPSDSPPMDIEIETSKFLLTYLGDQFCDLVEMEREAKKLHLSNDDTITWKRVVQGVREMCDVCETTLFNIHWVCHKCGFVVCIDCYKSRKTGLPKEESTSKDRDDFQWLLCSNRQPHEQDKLMLTQIIAGTALWDVSKSLHDIRRKWNIPTYCSCGVNISEQDGKSSSNGINKLMSAVTKCFSSDKDSSWDSGASSESQRSSKRGNKNSVNGVVKQEDAVGGYSSESGGSPLSWLADVALNSSTKNSDDQKDGDDEEKSSEGQESNAEASIESDDDKNENFSTLRELLIRPTAKMGGKSSGSSSGSQKTLTSTLDEVISCVIEQKVRKSDKKSKEKQLLHFTRRYQMSKSGRELPPVRTCILAESSLLYPEIPHLWLGSGKILLLKDPYHTGNMQMFQEQWKRGQPVIIADVGTRLDSSLWSPESFLKEFGDSKTDFLNCLCGTLMPNQLLRKFWEGFDNINKRMKDDDGESMVLKLVDWPPADEFSDILPTRHDDLMKVLPLKQYTHREGVLNMASRLPECFVQPDLGPRMYNAYGISSSLGKGSTNLHLDVSDAINILAYVSCDEKEEVSSEIWKALDESGCDSLMKKRAKERNSNPGALWHVYNARDADKIRDFLNKVSEEQGVKLNPHHDPIHNQEWYLDETLRNRLYKEYGVEPYTIAQCLGDAIFIPAGSPHQVLNLQSCVKVAEDFVSPESVSHSFFLTQEIRNLSDNLINCEDRLQIKNIIYHAVKDALALLQSHDPEESKT